MNTSFSCVGFALVVDPFRLWNLFGYCLSTFFSLTYKDLLCVSFCFFLCLFYIDDSQSALAAAGDESPSAIPHTCGILYC